MADVSLNPAFQSLRGKVGDLVFKKFNGRMIITLRPDMKNRILSQAQKDSNNRFRQAAIYGKMVMNNPQARAAYARAAKEKRQPMFSLMIADFFHAPEVNEIDLNMYTRQAGSTIWIQASDDFDVVSVDVMITTASDGLIEHGAAVKSTEDSRRWWYTAAASVPSGTPVRVEATAIDRPGHKGIKIVNA
jgi:hypothetical protein